MPCKHGRQRSKCKECGGASICQHGRERNKCKECGGSGICQHGRRRSDCKDCGGASICQHGRQRSKCKDCKATILTAAGEEAAEPARPAKRPRATTEQPSAVCTIGGSAVFTYGAGKQQTVAEPESAEAAGDDGVPVRRKSVRQRRSPETAAQAEESSESDSDSEDEPPRSGTSGWMAFPLPGSAVDSEDEAPLSELHAEAAGSCITVQASGCVVEGRGKRTDRGAC